MDFEQDRDDPQRRSTRRINTERQTAPTTDLGGSVLGERFMERVTSLVSEEPRTVREVHEVAGQSAGLSRDQTEYRLSKLSESGVINSKKASGKTSPKIFWKGGSE